MTSESPGPGGSLVTVLSARRKCCEDTHHSEQARQSERERETGLSKSQLPHSSHAQQAGSSVSQESEDTSLVKLCQHWSLIGQERVSLSGDMSL